MMKFKMITFAEICLRLQGRVIVCSVIKYVIDTIYFLANIIAFTDAIFSIKCHYGIISPIYNDYDGLMNISNGNRIGLPIESFSIIHIP
jgi:hypothetical protein